MLRFIHRTPDAFLNPDSWTRGLRLLKLVDGFSSLEGCSALGAESFAMELNLQGVASGGCSEKMLTPPKTSNESFEYYALLYLSI